MKTINCVEWHMIKVLRDSITQILFPNLKYKRKEKVKNKNAISAEVADQRYVNLKRQQILLLKLIISMNKINYMI